VISLVEDDADVRTATESLAKSHGFDVRAFESAQDFLRPHSVAQTQERSAFSISHSMETILFVHDAIRQGGGKVHLATNKAVSRIALQEPACG
jgi:hypothetical protein